LFRYLPDQSGYGKRLRSMGGLLAAVISELARDSASWHDMLRLVDSTPLPCAQSRETVKRSDLAGHARLRLLRQPLPLLLGISALPDLRAGRDAHRVGHGEPQAR